MATQIITQKNKMVLNVDELAKTLGISKPTAYELTRRDGFPAIRVSERRIIIPVEALCKWLEAEAVNGVTA